MLQQLSQNDWLGDLSAEGEPMRVFFAYLVVVTLCAAEDTRTEEVGAKKEFKSEHYTVSWGTPHVYEPETELEIGYGGGHGGTLRWLRFRPDKDGVDVVSIQFDGGRQPYESKWPPDRAPVAVKRARLKIDVYAELLRQLAIVESAKLKPVEQNGFTTSTHSFWVYAHLTGEKKALLDLNWAGYESSRSESDYAKPQAAVSLARQTINRLEFKDHTLTPAEREWASTKFGRDWKMFKGLASHWWVRERYIEMIGVVGDKTALPVLREILAAIPPKDRPRDASDGRCVYCAINAVTRLTRTDVRKKPIEEMDIERTRFKVLDLIRENK